MRMSLNNPLSAIDLLGLDCARLLDDGSVKVYTDEEDDCSGDNGYYFDGTVTAAAVDPNGNVVGTVDGKLTCSGDSNCAAWNNVASVTVNGGSAPQIAPSAIPIGHDRHVYLASWCCHDEAADRLSLPR